jgi:hypothetical protein
MAIVVEVQLDIDEDKLFRWPAYVTNLRSRLRCAGAASHAGCIATADDDHLHHPRAGC